MICNTLVPDLYAPGANSQSHYASLKIKSYLHILLKQSRCPQRLSLKLLKYFAYTLEENMILFHNIDNCLRKWNIWEFYFWAHKGQIIAGKILIILGKTKNNFLKLLISGLFCDLEIKWKNIKQSHFCDLIGVIFCFKISVWLCNYK